MDKSGYWVLAWELGVDSVKQNLLSLKSQILPLTNSANTPLASFSLSFSPPSLSPPTHPITYWAIFLLLYTITQAVMKTG
jgi:hypothetical protein